MSIARIEARFLALILVDLCRTISQMQNWIDEAKDKLMDIIAQAKNDVANLNLRVAFVG